MDYDSPLLVEHVLNQQFNLSLPETSEAQKKEIRRSLRKARAPLRDELLTHPGSYALLDAMGSKLVRPTNGGWCGGNTTHQSMEQGERRIELRHPAQWMGYEKIVPVPTEHPWSKREKASRLPAKVFVTDYDQQKSGLTLDALLADLPEWLCAAPSKTLGNFHVYYLLSEPTWKHLRPPIHWETDPEYNQGSPAWNPIFRTYFPNQGQYTIWNPRLWEGDVLAVDPQRFIGHRKRCTGAHQRVKRQPVPQRWRGATTEYPEYSDDWGVKYTSDELTALLKATIPGEGQRHANLKWYVQYHQAILNKHQGFPPTLVQLQQIAREGNSLFPLPQPPKEVESIAKWCLEKPLFVRQQAKAARAAMKRQLTSGQVYECLDRLVLLQIINKTPYPLPSKGFFHRWGEVTLHPDYEHYRTALWLKKGGTVEHLAEVSEYSIKQIKDRLRLYKAAYRTRWDLTPTDDDWNAPVG